MRKIRSFAFAALVLPLAVCDQRDALPQDCGPERWNLTEMAAPLKSRFAVERFDEVGLLAWRVAEDDRPLYVEGAIVAARSGSSWFLSRLFRHPRRQNLWRTAVIYDAVDHVPAQRYAAPPSPAEVQQFLIDAGWAGSFGGAFEILDEGACPVWWEEGR